MVDVEVAARELSTTLFPLEQDSAKKQDAAGDEVPRGYLLLTFAARGELLKGPPRNGGRKSYWTQLLQSMAMEETPTISDVETFRRVIASLINPGTVFGKVAFGAGSSKLVRTLSRHQASPPRRPEIELTSIAAASAAAVQIDANANSQAAAGTAAGTVAGVGDVQLGVRSGNAEAEWTFATPSPGTRSPTDRQKEDTRSQKGMLHREFGRAVRTASGGSVSKLGIGVVRAGSPHVVGTRPGRPHVLVELGSVEHTERLFAAGKIQVRGKTYRVTRPHNSDAQDIGSPARSTRGGAGKKRASSSTCTVAPHGGNGEGVSSRGGDECEGVDDDEDKGVVVLPVRSTPLGRLTLSAAKDGVEALV